MNLIELLGEISFSLLNEPQWCDKEWVADDDDWHLIHQIAIYYFHSIRKKSTHFHSVQCNAWKAIQQGQMPWQKGSCLQTPQSGVYSCRAHRSYSRPENLNEPSKFRIYFWWGYFSDIINYQWKTFSEDLKFEQNSLNWTHNITVKFIRKNVWQYFEVKCFVCLFSGSWIITTFKAQYLM